MTSLEISVLEWHTLLPTLCNPYSTFSLLHYLDNDVELKTIDSTIKGGEKDEILTETMVLELFQVVKDHDNEAFKSEGVRSILL